MQLGSCFAPAVCWTVFHVSEWNSSTVHLKTTSSHLFLESWGSLWPWLFCYAAPSSAGSSWWGSLNFHLKRSVCLRRGWWTKKLGQLTCVSWLVYTFAAVIQQATPLIYYAKFLTLWVTYHAAANVGNVLTPQPAPPPHPRPPPSVMENRRNVPYK